MSGKPASRMGDMTAFGGPITQGSLGVMIGAPTGVACSVCPGRVVSGNPVNPLLGAKVLPDETDLALPGPMPFVLSRTYSSYQTKTPAPVGVLGPGWKAPSDICLQIREHELILNDTGGRSIHFEPLLPGELAFSRSESFWLARGGVAKLFDGHPLAMLWSKLPEALRLSPHVYLATNSLQGPWWILGWPERVPSADEMLPAPLPPHRVLTGLVDNFGRALRFHRAADGAFAGTITTVTDGAGRRFGLNYVRLPDVPQTHYGADTGLRLTKVWLTHDPDYPQDLPVAPLVRYAYSPRGELVAVHDRSGTEIRHFTYDEQFPGRMVAHHYAGRPEIQYRYDAAGRVTAQHNPAGLSYAYAYEKNQVTVTDSLNRREALHTEGEGGLKRVVKKVFADGSSTTSEFAPYGRLVAQTDAAGRRTVFRLSPGSGLLDAVVSPDGRITTFSYSPQRQLIRTTYPDGLRTQREYDPQGRLTAETDRHGDTVRYRYDSESSEYPATREDPTGSQQQMTWSRSGQLLSFTDCSGYETRYEYDRFGQLTAVHHEEGLSLRREYDARGQLVCQTDAAGYQTRYEYNAAGDLTAMVLPDGTRHETQFDAAGRTVSSTTGSLTRQMAYDTAGRIIQLTNENGRHTAFTYDILDRLTQQIGFDGRTQRWQYNLTGKLAQSDDEGLITQWHYDEADRLMHRTVNGEPAEQWQYDERGWLTGISHLSEGLRVAVRYDYSDQGRLTGERQTVHAPDSEELLWQHETRHAWQAGLVSRVKPDNLAPVEWLTYGSGHLAGMKLGDAPLIDFTRDRLHRETQRSFGSYELTTAYTPTGQLLSRHTADSRLSQDYSWNTNGELIAQNGRQYQYENGRLRSTRIDDQQYISLTDPAGNRLTDSPLLPKAWPDNRIGQDAHYYYQLERHGNLTEKNERTIREFGSHTHHYGYDAQHRLVQYQRMQNGYVHVKSRYRYDPLGRRISKQVWKATVFHDGSCSQPELKQTVWYGWDGDHLTTTETADTRIQTVYLPGSFIPLLRIETTTDELKKAVRHTLTQKLEQAGNVTLPPELTSRLERLEQEIQQNTVSEDSRQWLAGCGLTVEQMVGQMEPVYTPERAIHLYHCDHRGLPLALINEDASLAWQAEYDEWGNLLREDNPDNFSQLIRLPGQQYDDETGLYYNRHRYYDPQQGRYINQDPIGLRGGWNVYGYPLDPVRNVDPLGLFDPVNFGDGFNRYCQGVNSAVTQQSLEEASETVHNMETMHNAYNPLSEYVLGLSVGSAIIGMAGTNLTVASIADRSAACIKDVTESIITDGERQPKNLALTCGKSFINEGSSSLQGKMSDFLIDTLSSYDPKQ